MLDSGTLKQVQGDKGYYPDPRSKLVFSVKLITKYNETDAPNSEFC